MKFSPKSILTVLAVAVYAALFQVYGYGQAVLNGSSIDASPVTPNATSGGAATFSSITDTGLTSGRLVLVGTGGLLQDSANFTYVDGTTTGQIIHPVGAVGTPSMTFLGDPDNGPYYISTNYWGLSSGGTKVAGLAATAIDFPSTLTGGLQLYNTSDQTTNYERFITQWNTNTLYIGTETGGTGTGRDINFGAFNGAIGALAGPNIKLSRSSSMSATNPGIMFRWGGTQSGVGPFFGTGTGTLNSSATSGSVVLWQFGVTYNQASGSASNTDVLINRIETLIGSGAQNFLDMQISGASRARFSTTGQVLSSTMTNGIRLFNQSDETTNGQRLDIIQTGSNGVIGTITYGTAAGVPLNLAAESSNGAASFSKIILGGTGTSKVRMGFYTTTTGTTLASTGTNSDVFAMGEFISTLGSGQMNVFSIIPTINQSGTTSNTGLKVAVTETALGTGTQLLASFAGGSAATTTVASIGSPTYGALPSGATTAGTAITVPATTFTLTGTNTATAFQGSYFGAPTFTNASAGTITDAFNTVKAGPAVAAGSTVITRGHTLGILDSTSASSSITGGLVVATAFGTTATSVGIGGGNINAGGTIIAGVVRMNNATGVVDTSSGGQVVLGSSQGAIVGQVGAGGTRLDVSGSSGAIAAYTNNVLGWTLDTSQNITFSGKATVTKPFITVPSALTYASPTSVDVTLASCFTVTTVNATGSVTFNATAGGTSGQEMTILITNDATSAKTITFGTNFLSTGTLTASAASRHTSIVFKSDGTNWYETGRAVLTN